MSWIQYLLCKLAEECNEIAQRALKAQQFGITQHHPSYPKNNEDMLHDEINDFYAIVELLQAEGYLQGHPNSTTVSVINSIDLVKIEAKKQKIRKYYDISKHHGQVE